MIKYKWFSKLQFKSLRIKQHLFDNYYRDSLVREDLFKSVRIGNAIRISKRSFDHWLESLDL